MELRDIMALGMVAAIVSFMGFVVENIWLAVTKGYMDNRNMCFPFLIGYGIAMLLIYSFLGTPDHLRFLGRSLEVPQRGFGILLYFMGVMICVSAGEILLGTFVEKTCHFAWWDYSRLPLHITRYTSVPTSVMFSVMVTAFMDTVFGKLCDFFMKWDYYTLCTVVGVLVGIMVFDFLYNAWKMYKNQGLISRWRIDVSDNAYYNKINPQIFIKNLTKEQKCKTIEKERLSLSEYTIE